MRLYELTITDADGSVWYPETSGLGFVKQSPTWGASFSSLYTPWVLNTASSPLAGQANPSALNVEIDLQIAPAHTLQGQGSIRIWGLGVRALGQAANLNATGNPPSVFKIWTLRAGMSAGLPLANPSQSGILAGGIIYQAFGNWEDVNQTLELIVQNGPTPLLTTAISWQWTKGQALSAALKQMFSQAFPAYAASINISENLIAPSTQTGCYMNLGSFSKYLLAYTQRIGAQQYGSGYGGVSIVAKNNGIFVIDGQGTTPASHQLAFQDLVGQPTWIAANTITFATVMRGDIDYGDTVTFPTGTQTPYALTTPGAAFPNSPAASATAFQGAFLVTEIHHYGNFREPQASSWATVFTAVLDQTTPELGVDLLD